ncbi:RimK/LysX family protein [Nanoarchaeota archaeon]
MPKRPVLGLTEKITVIGPEKKKTVMARIDTGATKSSIDVALAADLKLGPVISKKLVKSASGTIMRPVIKAKVTLIRKNFNEEFTLAERSHLKYPVLIGQNILKKEKFLIDPLK